MIISFQFDRLNETTYRGIVFSTDGDQVQVEDIAKGNLSDLAWYFRDKSYYCQDPLSWICHRTKEAPDALTIFEAAEAACPVDFI